MPNRTGNPGIPGFFFIRILKLEGSSSGTGIALEAHGFIGSREHLSKGWFEMYVQGQINSALRDPNDVAKAELARFRKRLGKLTPAQEVAVEDLLISAVTKACSLADRVMESLISNFA